MKQFSYEITNVIATLSVSPKNGWHKKLCMVSWNNRKPKLDLREWAPEGAKGRAMGKGVTFSAEEASALAEAIGSLNIYSDTQA